MMGLMWYDGSNASSTLTSVIMGTSTSLTLTPKSPEAANSAAGAGAVYIAYLLSAPQNASSTITATFGKGHGEFMNAFCDDFAHNSGTVAFDSDAIASGSGTTINTPSIPVTGSTDLLYSVGGGNGGITGIGGSWQLGGGGISADASASAFIGNATSTTAVSMSNSSGVWDAIGASFKFTAAAAGGSGPSVKFRGGGNPSVKFR